MTVFRKKHHFVFPLVPSVMAIGILIALIGLGAWQISRLHWKEGVLEKVHDNRKYPPVAIESLLSDMNFAKWEYRKVNLEGYFLHDLEMRLVPKAHKGRPGYHLITPFRLKSGEVVLVNRGWIARNEPYESINRPESMISLVGTINPIKTKNYFTPKNNFDKGEIFHVDVNEFARFSNLVTLLPLYVVAEPNSAQESSTYPVEMGITLNIPNNHLIYAITWFALAIALLIIYSIFVYQWNHRLRVLNE